MGLFTQSMSATVGCAAQSLRHVFKNSAGESRSSYNPPPLASTSNPSFSWPTGDPRKTSRFVPKALRSLDVGTGFLGWEGGFPVDAERLVGAFLFFCGLSGLAEVDRASIGGRELVGVF